ncbi:helix-turn-helix domain-containing protein [[Mycobacterium] kokjensenii]|uniref:Helix-turn-helix domain-containing protein n=1 Tax=[Mycobacterium] kokjensenii TaxID=3064287 RepID=A0ABN9N955_9MYCO|nr:helix-turn-helix domain-containing protein [Mycolicibacter sp. MU0083]CAJ1499683.1 helix-turn-helix domain-containing protein [Mycolicibacter sp. MU0083]
MSNSDRDLTGIGALADPVRRELYRFVVSQAGPVSRDEAAAATGLARHQAKFHLDRLEADGLLESDYARAAGRSGPGAGRPSKRYRRSRCEIAVSLPPREYELAGRLMADAIAEAAQTGAPVLGVLDRLAREHGRELGTAACRSGPPTDAAAALESATAVLGEHGYEPYRGDGEVRLANCPFHALAQSQTQLACSMNLALIGGVADALTPHCPQTRLDPDPSRCCVVLAPGTASPPP